MKKELDDLLALSSLLWRGNEFKSCKQGVKTGFEELDDILPEKGWPNNALIEVVSDCEGIGELQLFLPLIARLTAKKCWVAWICPPYMPYPPSLSAAGVDLDYVLVINSVSNQQESLWAMEKLLLNQSCGLCLCWLQPKALIKLKMARRLQLAAETGMSHGVLFSQILTSGVSAALRLQISPMRLEYTQVPQTKKESLSNPKVSQTLQRELLLQVLKVRGSSRYQAVHLSLPH